MKKNRISIIAIVIFLVTLIRPFHTFCGENDFKITDITTNQSTQTNIKGQEIDIIVTYIDDEIVLDGILNDPAWTKAVPYEAHFFQQLPLDREPSGEKTKVMVLQNNDTIYFGIMAYYSNPEQIFIAGMRRDKDIMRGDNIELLIDTFRDNRTCYAFVTNPLGGEQDAIISDEGNDINKSWDCV